MTEEKKMRKSYKFRLYPNRQQEQTLDQWIGCSRWVWNHMLELNKQKYSDEQKFAFYVEMNNLLPDIKKQEETRWLKDAPSQVLQQKCQDLGTAIGRKFKVKGAGFPRFKSKKHDQSGIRFPQGWRLRDDEKVDLPKLKGVKLKQHRSVVGIPSYCTVSKDRCGDWWITILTSTKATEPRTLDPKLSVGIDVGLKAFAVTSEGEIVANPKFLKKSQRRLTQRQRRHSMTKKESKNREKTRLRLARVHRKISRQRKDHTNKFVSAIVKSNDIVCVEDLNITGMKKSHQMARAISDASWGLMFNRLGQKLAEEGKLLIKIDQFAPSSKSCSCCGSLQEMPLNIRTYKCLECGAELDRDFNAAINIRNWALQHKFGTASTVGTTESHACGDMISVKRSAHEAVATLVRL